MRAGPPQESTGVWSLLPASVLGHHQESSYFLDSGHLEGGCESTLGEQDPVRLPARWEGSGLCRPGDGPEPQVHLSLCMDLCET